MKMAETTYCPKHPGTATSIRCSKCDTVICAQCMVQTPVGARCKDCAQVRRSPIYDVSAPLLARAIGASLAIGVAGGLALVLLGGLVLGSLFIYAIVAAGIGYAIGEGVSAATNRKRGRTLQFVAAGGMLVVGVVVLLAFGAVEIVDLIAVAIGIFVAVGRLR